MVLFLDRVYGVENLGFLLHLIEVGFLPDLQAAVSLDTVRTKHFMWLLLSPDPRSPFNPEQHVVIQLSRSSSMRDLQDVWHGQMVQLELCCFLVCSIAAAVAAEHRRLLSIRL